MPWTALAAAAALHGALFAATLSFVHPVPPPAEAAVEQVVQMTFVPAAVATPKKAEAAAVVTTPEAVAAAEPAAASPVPEAVPPEPREAAAPEPREAVVPEPPDEPRSQEPVAEPPAVAAQTVAAPEEPPAEAPATSDAVISLPLPPPALSPPQPQPRLPVARHLTPPPVASGRAHAPVPEPRQSNVSVVAGVAGAVGQAAAQGTAHDTDQEASLEASIRDAVQAAVHYPAAARMMDVTGRARVQLNYRNGVVDGPLLAQSSGVPMLDQAALNAAQSAHYPATPTALAGRLMRFLVWVEFRTG